MTFSPACALLRCCVAVALLVWVGCFWCVSVCVLHFLGSEESMNHVGKYSFPEPPLGIWGKAQAWSFDSLYVSFLLAFLRCGENLPLLFYSNVFFFLAHEEIIEGGVDQRFWRDKRTSLDTFAYGIAPFSKLPNPWMTRSTLHVLMTKFLFFWMWVWDSHSFSSTQTNSHEIPT